MDLRLVPIEFNKERGDEILKVTPFSLNRGKGLEVNLSIKGEILTANYEVDRDFIKRPRWEYLIEKMKRDLESIERGEIYLAYRTNNDSFLLLSISSF